MFIMIWATAVFNFWSVSQRVDFKYRALVIITLISSIAKPVLGIILVRLADDKVTARILGLALVEVVTCTGLFVAQLRRGRTLYVKKILGSCTALQFATDSALSVANRIE